VSLVWVCALFTSASAMPFAGVALDRIGSRKLMCIVSPIYILFVCSMGLVNSWYTLAFCLAGLRFIGAECLVLIASVTPNKWFVRKRGKAAAYLSLVSSASVGFSGFF
jgi:MFS family permease